MMIPLCLVVMVVLPIAWCLSEFQSNIPLRLILGWLAWGSAFLASVVVGGLLQLQYTADDSLQADILLDTVLQEIEAGRTERLQRELRSLGDDFAPNYEQPRQFEALVTKLRQRLSTPETAMAPAAPDAVGKDSPAP